jgi:protein SCO1/2
VYAVPDRALRSVGVLVAGLVLALGLVACGSSPSAAPVFHGSRIGTPWQVPATTLTDASGKDWSITQATAPLTLVFFGYTECPDVCPQEMADITSALVRLTPAERKQVDVVFVTTDPARDNPAALTRYLGAFDASYTGLTGTPKALGTLTTAFHVYAAKEQAAMEDGKGYLVAHDDHTFAVTANDKGHQVVAMWDRDRTSAQIAEDIHTLLKEKS